MSKFCVKCGTSLDDNATFCTNCGEKVITETYTNNNPNIVINNVINNKSEGTKKVGVFTILGYVIGIPLAISSIGMMATGNIGGGICYLLAALCILPFINDLLEKRFKFKLSKILRIILFLILISIGAPFATMNEMTKETKISKTDVPAQVINVSDTINVDDWNIKIDEAKLTEKWKINTDNKYYSSNYEAETGKIYAVVKISVKNSSNENKIFKKQILDPRIIGNVDYKYTMLLRNDDIYDFDSTYLIEPLETKTFYLYNDIPKEATSNSVIVEYNLGSKKYDLKIK